MIPSIYTVFGRRYGNPLLLDTYATAILGLSLRQIKEGYTGYAIAVRRSSDNTIAYIPFVSGALDTTTLMAHVGAGSGYVHTWYSQSGAVNAVQATNSLQPRIVNSGTLETVDGLPAIYFVEGNYLSFSAITVSGAWSVFTVGKRFASGTAYTPISGTAGAPSAIMHYSDNNFYFQRGGATPGYLYSSSDTSANQMLLSAFARVGSQYMYKNGSVISSTFGVTSIGTTLERIGTYTSMDGKGHLQEIILYDTDKYDDRPAIATNINTYYTIY